MNTRDGTVSSIHLNIERGDTAFCCLYDYLVHGHFGDDPELAVLLKHLLLLAAL